MAEEDGKSVGSSGEDSAGGEPAAGAGPEARGGGEPAEAGGEPGERSRREPASDDERTAAPAGERASSPEARRPGLAPEAVPPPAPAHHPLVERFPWASISLIALFVVLFALELAAGVAPTSEMGSPAPITLIAMGGSMRSAVIDDGEWYRMFTATLLHGGFLHLLMNSVALWMAGAFLESVLHRTWFLALFVIGGLGGSVASLAINPPNVVSVGASGAIMALLAAAVVLAFRVPGDERSAIQAQILRILVPSLLPIFATGGGGAVDYGAHLGGAVVGAAAGWILLKSGVSLNATDPTSARRPGPGARLAQVITAFGGILFIVGFFSVYRGYDKYREIGEAVELIKVLIPQDKVPDGDTTAEQARALTTSYPRDPRGWFILAAHTIDAGDPTAAKAMLERALTEKRILDVAFVEHRLEIGIRALLVQILLEEGKRAEAAAAAAPACHYGPEGAVPEPLAPLNVCP